MDDRKVFEMERLRLAYQKQIVFVIGLIVLGLMGLSLYIWNIVSYRFGLFLVAVVMIITCIIGIMTIDQKMKLISEKIRSL